MSVEAEDVGQHLVHGRVLEIAAVGKDGVEVGGSVEKAGRLVCDTEAHFGVDGLDAQVGEESLDVGIVLVVVDDEARVDTDLARSGVVDRHRVRMAAQAITSFEDGDVVVWSQHMRARQPGDT